MNAVEALAAPPTGEPARDRRAFLDVLGQALDESRPSPMDDYGFDEWWDRFGRWLWQGWPEAIRPHPGWATILREAADEGPAGCGCRWPEGWAEALETVMAVWLRRGPDTILPLLHRLIHPSDHPRLAFVVVHEYLARGPYPLTPEILDLLERSLPFAREYDDETAEWLVLAVHATRADGMLAQLATLLCEDQPDARRVLRELKAEG